MQVKKAYFPCPEHWEIHKALLRAGCSVLDYDGRDTPKAILIEYRHGTYPEGLKYVMRYRLDETYSFFPDLTNGFREKPTEVVWQINKILGTIDSIRAEWLGTN